MPTATYNGKSITHIVPLQNISQNGITLDTAQPRYGIDHYGNKTINGNLWWRVALNQGYARRMYPCEYPKPQFPPGRLPNGRVFPRNYYALINTTQLTIAQVRFLRRQPEVFDQPILNQSPADNKTRRAVIPIAIPRDSQGQLQVPTWITNNMDKIIGYGDLSDTITFLNNRDTYHFLDDIPNEELVVVCSDGEIGGGTL